MKFWNNSIPKSSCIISVYLTFSIYFLFKIISHVKSTESSWHKLFTPDTFLTSKSYTVSFHLFEMHCNKLMHSIHIGWSPRLFPYKCISHNMMPFWCVSSVGLVSEQSMFVKFVIPLAITWLITDCTNTCTSPLQPFLCKCCQLVIEFRSANTQNLVPAFKKKRKSQRDKVMAGGQATR